MRAGSCTRWPMPTPSESVASMMTMKRAFLSSIAPPSRRSLGLRTVRLSGRFFDDFETAHPEAVDLYLAQARFADFQPADGERPDGQSTDRQRADRQRAENKGPRAPAVRPVAAGPARDQEGLPSGYTAVARGRISRPSRQEHREGMQVRASSKSNPKCGGSGTAPAPWRRT